MKKIALFVAVVAALIGLNLTWNALGAGAIMPLAAQPVNTPAAPGDVGSIVKQEVLSPLTAPVPSQAQSPVPLIQQQIPSDGLSQQAPPYTRISRSDGMRFQTAGTGMVVTGYSSPQSPSAETCMDVLANPQMDVLENGDGTGTVDSWTILAQNIYYSTVYSHSASYSLKEMDELDGSDTDGITIGGTYWDYDEFGQAFLTPGGLTYLKVSFSSLYFEPDVNDNVYARLWTLDSQGNLDELIAYPQVPDDPASYPQYTWGNYYFELTSSQLITASGKSLALVFTMFSNQQSPSQRVYLDDAQVRLCYNVGANKVYLPVVIRQPQSTSPTCSPYEPDNRDSRGYTMVGATCYGSFGPSDDKDYYTLNLNGVANVRLKLDNLPTGSNYDALIYEYPYTGQQPACYIGTPGSQNKYKDCPPLDLGKTYFAFVNAGGAPSSAKTYEMSVVSRSTPPPGWVTLLSENFEGSFPGAWQVTSNGGYSWGKRNCKPYAGSYSGWAVGGGANGTALSCGSNYSNNVDTAMTYGPFSLAGATAGDLKFKLWLNSESNYDFVCRYASIDGNNFSGTCTSGNSSGWIDRVLDLANAPTLGNLMGRSNVWIALRFISDGSNTYPEGAYVDDIVLRKCTSASCPATSSITTDSGNGQFVDVPATSLLPRVR